MTVAQLTLHDGPQARSVPFPVHAGERPRPDLRKLGPGVAICTGDHLEPAYREAKWHALRTLPQRCLARAAAPDLQADPAGVTAALRALCRHAPERFVALDGQRVRLPACGLVVDAQTGVVTAVGTDAGAIAQARWLAQARFDPAGRVLCAIALAMQEDVVVMAEDGAGQLRAEWLAVCFPSGWDPAQVAGAGFGAIHAPVADNAALLAAGRALAAAMVDKGPFERFVWTVAPTGALSRHPASPAPAFDGDVDRLWWRCERQVTVPVPEARRSVFLIRIHVAPLAVVLDDAAASASLDAALAAMRPETLAYKGLEAIAPAVRRRIAARHQAAAD